MASLEKRGEWYRLIFKYGGERFTHSLHTDDEKTAAALKGGIERTILQLQQRLLRVPDGADVKEFIVSGGQVAVPKAATKPAEQPTKPATLLTLEQIKTKYVETMSIGAIEENSLDTVKMHLRHFLKTLGADFPLQNLTQANLQDHIVKRSKDRGIRTRLLSPTTMRKEIASLRAVWNWGVQAGLLAGSFPNKGLKFPKTTERPPFQTYEQIERQIAQGGISETERRELWDCLYLTLPEIDELLEHVRKTAIQPFLFPMFCFLAHSGAMAHGPILCPPTGFLQCPVVWVRAAGRIRQVHDQTPSAIPAHFARPVCPAWTPIVLWPTRDHPAGSLLSAVRFCHLYKFRPFPARV
jgi:hypothetical protein